MKQQRTSLSLAQSFNKTISSVSRQKLARPFGFGFVLSGTTLTSALPISTIGFHVQAEKRRSKGYLGLATDMVII